MPASDPMDALRAADPARLALMGVEERLEPVLARVQREAPAPPRGGRRHLRLAVVGAVGASLAVGGVVVLRQNDVRRVGLTFGSGTTNEAASSPVPPPALKRLLASAVLQGDRAVPGTLRFRAASFDDSLQIWTVTVDVSRRPVRFGPRAFGGPLANRVAGRLPATIVSPTDDLSRAYARVGSPRIPLGRFGLEGFDVLLPRVAGARATRYVYGHAATNTARVELFSGSPRRKVAIALPREGFWLAPLPGDAAISSVIGYDAAGRQRLKLLLSPQTGRVLEMGTAPAAPRVGQRVRPRAAPVPAAPPTKPRPAPRSAPTQP